MLVVKIEHCWSKAIIKKGKKKKRIQCHGWTIASRVAKFSFELTRKRLLLHFKYHKTEWTLNQTLQKSNSAQGDPRCLAWSQSNEHFKAKDKTGDPHSWAHLYTICTSLFFFVSFFWRAGLGLGEIKSPNSINKTPVLPFKDHSQQCCSLISTDKNSIPLLVFHAWGYSSSKNRYSSESAVIKNNSCSLSKK